MVMPSSEPCLVFHSATHTGERPRPVQVCEESFGLRYFGATVPPDFLPPPVSLLTVAQARRSASLSETPRSS